MGKRKHRHRSSNDEDREKKLQKRIERLEEQILCQRGENHENKRSKYTKVRTKNKGQTSLVFSKG